MSDLVEKVAREMTRSMNADPDQVIDGVIMWHHFIPDARAAIKAVLEYYSDPRNISDRMADARLTELNIDDIRSNHRTAIASAMAAALRQLEASDHE